MKYDLDLEKRLRRGMDAISPMTPDDIQIYEQAGELFDYAKEAIKKEFQYNAVKLYQKRKQEGYIE